MAEERPPSTLTWRKTVWKRETLYTLLSWENVLCKEELPPEYVNWGAPRFWADDNDKIQIPVQHQHENIHIPTELYRGQVFTEVNYTRLVSYLRSACEWLRRVKPKVGEAEEVVVELVPSTYPIHKEAPVHDEKEDPKKKRSRQAAERGVYLAGVEDAHRSDAKLALIFCAVAAIIGFALGKAV